MFPRKVDDYLQSWKVKKERKPLILRGARQVGKTSAVLLFGKNNFEQVVHINLEKPEHARLFPGEVSLKEFETIVNVAFGQKLVPGKTLLFIDEIQENPFLLKLLRFFFEEIPQLHVIAAGSLLDIKLKETGFPVPVGRVEFAYLYPLDFFEYLQLKDLAEFYQGRIAEQIVGQQLLSSFVNVPPQLFYWYKKTGSEAEVDFCLVHQGKLVGLEVKNGPAGRLKSMWEFVKETDNDKAVRVYGGPAKVEERKIEARPFTFISVPFYLLPRWKEFLA